MFEKYDKQSGRNIGAFCTITDKGQLGISSVFGKSVGISAFNFCDLYFDREERIIGIYLLKESTDCSLKIGKNRDYCTIRVVGFLNHFNIKNDVTKRYPAVWDEEMRLIIIRLEGER